MKLKSLVFLLKNYPSKRNKKEFSWIFKHNCPCCLAEPIETLSNYEYSMKYPAKNKFEIGIFTIYLCDYHLKELCEKFRKR